MFRCRKCKGESVSTDTLNSTHEHIGQDTLEAVSTFRYLGDVIGESCGCMNPTNAHITPAWSGFRQLLSIIINHRVSPKNRGNIFSSCIRKILLYYYDPWLGSSKTVQRLISADNGMIH